MQPGRVNNLTMPLLSKGHQLVDRASDLLCKRVYIFNSYCHNVFVTY